MDLDISKFCTPALVYFILAVLAMIIQIVGQFNFQSLLVKAIFTVGWTLFLNFLCSRGYENVSWFLVILPYIVMLGLLLIVAQRGGLPKNL